MSTMLNSMPYRKTYLETLNMHRGAEIPQQCHLELFKYKKLHIDTLLERPFALSKSAFFGYY